MLALPQIGQIPVHSTELAVDGNPETIIGGLSAPSKMPSFGYSIDARRCVTGSKLRTVAGSVCSKCYACKGRYVFPNVRNAMERRYRSLFDPRWTVAMATAIRWKAMNVFRWHDSGDIQSVSHLRNIVNVAILTPDVRHWLPTREYGMVREYLRTYGEFPDNLVVRVSAPMMDGAASAEFAHTSEVAKTAEYAESRKANGANLCPAPNQGNKCLDCRACWDKNVPTVVYHAH
jgi:hypothetical protein